MNAWCACVALVAALAPAAASAQGVLRRPEGPPMQAGVLTTVPSKAAGSYGVAVRVFAPSRARFSAGAPVVVHVAGGVQAGGPNGRPDMQAHGFVEVFFGFPTDGGYDCRGPRSIRALADVIRFASGRASDVRGNSIADLTAPIKPLAQNCGLLGSSNGGNASIMAMALHGSEFADLAFYVSMESPIGEGAVAAELGGFGSPVNPAYDPASGRLDVGRLAWADDLPIGSFPRTGASGLKGALYFDMDGNGRHDPIADYPANAMVADIGGGTRAWYSPRLLREAERRSLLPRPRPTHVPTVREADEFWRYRDAAPSIPAAIRHCPTLVAIVYAGERDHVQVAPDHPHILTQIEGLRTAGARFVRLNPDAAYARRMLAFGPPMRPGPQPRFADNDAGRAYDRRNIRDALEPAVLPIGLYVQAALCEVADRVQARRWDRNLDGVLFPEAPFGPPARR